MTANAFKPPNFIFILETDTVHFIGPIAHDEVAQPFDTFPGTVDIRQDQGEHVLFANAIFYKRIGAKDAGI